MDDTTGQTLTQIKAMLAERGIQPRKRFGQNFLVDQNKVTQIVTSAQINAGDTVMEVGPGTGVLTERLLAEGVHVIAVEIDRDLCDILRDRFADKPHFTLIEGDVLASKHALSDEVGSALRIAMANHGVEAFQLIANLPYNIASPLLANLATDWPQMRRALVMIQREVAGRITAQPGGKAYGPLGVLLQAFFHTQTVMELPPGCFWPRPQIDSAVIELTRRDQPLTPDGSRLSRMLQRLFTKRRKQIGSILGRDFPWPQGIDPNKRPEQLTVEQIIALAELDADD